LIGATWHGYGLQAMIMIQWKDGMTSKLVYGDDKVWIHQTPYATLDAPPDVSGWLIDAILRDYEGSDMYASKTKPECPYCGGSGYCED
jgi:hypothetical protein